MDPVLESSEQSILGRGLFSPGEGILVAVSGGLDSMVLLHVLHALAGAHGWRLTAAHFNHRLRGRSSLADENLVRRFSLELKLPLVMESAKVRDFARTQKLSLEMAARKLRHEFLARTATSLGLRKVALAHHADDQVELFFLRLLRGGGTEALAGMKWRNASPANSKLQVVRPLLRLSKEALADYARRNKVPFREDATNACLEIQRNLLRHELLPLLRRKYQPALGQTVLRVMEIVGGESEFVQAVSQAWLNQNLSRQGSVARQSTCNVTLSPRFERLPLAVQRRCIHFQLAEAGVPPSFELVEKLRTSSGKLVSVPGRCVRRDAQGLLHLESPRKLPPGLEFREVVLANLIGEVTFGPFRAQWRLETARGAKRPRPVQGREFFDADAVGSAVVLRHWRAGDRFQPSGLERAVKLQDLFTNQKVPRGLRSGLVVAEAANGELFWVEGMRISERFKLGRNTTRRLRWTWHRTQPTVAGFNL